MFLTRNLFKIHFSNTPFKRAEIDKLRLKTQNKLAVSDDELKYFSLKVKLVIMDI